ncbi:MAG: hypothetical protein ACRDV2_05565, partial [Actinomycetes bacterium]
MLHQGPVPAVVHGVLEYAVAILFIVAPFVLGSAAPSATAASLVVRLPQQTYTAMSALPSGLVPS